MGKEEELWDDSALVNAFEEAISKYKIMHGKGGRDNSLEGGKAISNTEENLSALVDENHETKRHIVADYSSNVASNITTETGEISNLSPIKENHLADSCVPEPYRGSSNGQHVQDSVRGYSNAQGSEDYNQLVNKYYELEDQRQKILQQLHQSGSWNYEGYGSGVHWGTSSTSQDHIVSAGQASYSTVVCSCCPYVCQCLVTPCTSLPSCALASTCVGKTCDAASATVQNGKSSVEEGDFIKMAMGAAEKALSSLNKNCSDNSDFSEARTEKEKEAEMNVRQLTQSVGSETDLAVVLNAWYSAGLYTGKYLSEQSFAKKRHS